MPVLPTLTVLMLLMLNAREICANVSQDILLVGIKQLVRIIVSRKT